MPYIIQTASVHMPASVRSPYRRVAVLEVEPGVARASMISPRAKGVRRVVATWERLSVGRTERCAYRRALAEAQELVARLSRVETGEYGLG